jgi:hypothetical protein
VEHVLRAWNTRVASTDAFDALVVTMVIFPSMMWGLVLGMTCVALHRTCPRTYASIVVEELAKRGTAQKLAARSDAELGPHLLPLWTTVVGLDSSKEKSYCRCIVKVSRAKRVKICDSRSRS